MAEKYATVAVSDVTYWVDRPYDYHVPDKLSGAVLPGTRVVVPFARGNRRAEGIVLRILDKCDYPKIKDIEEVLDDKPVLTRAQLDLALWMRERFFCTVYEAVRAILPAGLWFDKTGARQVKDKKLEYAKLLVLPGEALALAESKAKKSPMQALCLNILADVNEAGTADLRAMTGATRSSIKALETAGLIELYSREVFRRPDYKRGGQASLPELNSFQQSALTGLGELMMQDKAQAALLFGVTGSGKTAVYIHLINNALSAGKSVILLVPEIALTPQMLETFSSHFGENTAVLHSSLSNGERYDEWKRIKSGTARLVIGTRSAIFAPCENLGLIIIDEEQEETYKSENSPRYHAKDIAKYRCAGDKALLLLGSATPGISTRYEAEKGSYSFFELPNRFNEMPLPDVSIVDMKAELRRRNSEAISSFLKEELQKNIENREQSILFLNRRGEAKLITCVDCGYNYSCQNCSVSLTYHRVGNKLMCHSCGYTRRVDDSCPDCGGTLKYIGDGTQKIEEQLGNAFPDVQILRVDADTVAKAGSHEALFERFKIQKIPIMIGTQMVTKGLNFENVTLVGVVCADQSLFVSDYRAAERTFSLITQVVGRSGRSKTPGRAVIQTYTPDNQVIRLAANQDYNAFYEQEIKLRALQGCPPFSQVFSLSVCGADEHNVLSCCQYIKTVLLRELAKKPNISVLGPAPFVIVKVKNQYRYRVLLLCSPDKEIRMLISQMLHHCNGGGFGGVSVYADLNPND